MATPSIELDPRDFHEPGDEVRRVVMLGRLSPWKGQDVFLRAFAEAFEGSPAEAFVVGGALFGEDEYEQSLKTRGRASSASPTGCTSSATSRTRGPRSSTPTSWCTARRIPEPFGQVVVQGLWARCAVVASTPGGPAEVITDGVDGLLDPVR